MTARSERPQGRALLPCGDASRARASNTLWADLPIAACCFVSPPPQTSALAHIADESTSLVRSCRRVATRQTGMESIALLRRIVCADESRAHGPRAMAIFPPRDPVFSRISDAPTSLLVVARLVV